MEPHESRYEWWWSWWFPVLVILLSVSCGVFLAYLIVWVVASSFIPTVTTGISQALAGRAVRKPAFCNPAHTRLDHARNTPHRVATPVVFRLDRRFAVSFYPFFYPRVGANPDFSTAHGTRYTGARALHRATAQLA